MARYDECYGQGRRVHARREDRRRPRRRASRPCGRPSRRLHPHALPRRQARPVWRLPHVRRRRRGLAASASGLRDARRRGPRRLDELGRPAVPEDADGDAPRRAREPGSGWPAERARRHGGGDRRGGAVPPSRLEARAVRRPQPFHGLRPGRMHPVCALRPLHARGHAVLGALARGAWAARAHRPHARPFLARHGVRALWRLPLRLPDRRHLREVRGGHGAARARAREGQDDVHVLRRRLPGRPECRSGDEAHRQGDIRPDLPARTKATSASRDDSRSTSSITRIGSPTRSSAARTASSTRRRGSTHCGSPPTGSTV